MSICLFDFSMFIVCSILVIIVCYYLPYVPLILAILCFNSEMEAGWEGSVWLVSMVFSLSATDGKYRM